MSSISASAQRGGAAPSSLPASPPPPTTIAAVAHSRDRTAVASFDATTRHLVVMHAPDAPVGPDAFAALTDALTELRPSRVHASASTDGRLLAALASAAPRTGFEVRLERSALFAGGHSAARALAAVCGAPARGGALTAAAALDEPAQAAALGGLASVLLRDGGGDEEDEDGGGSLVESIAEAPIPLSCTIDDHALTSLSIHTVDAHPSAAGVGASKPGACITTLMDQGVTPAGRALTRAWLLRPSRDAGTLASRHAAVAWLVERGDVLDAVRAALRRVRSPQASLAALRACNGRPCAADVASLVDGCAALAAAAAVLTDARNGDDLPALLAAVPAALAHGGGTLHRARLAVVAALDIPGAAAGANPASCPTSTPCKPPTPTCQLCSTTWLELKPSAWRTRAPRWQQPGGSPTPPLTSKCPPLTCPSAASLCGWMVVSCCTPSWRPWGTASLRSARARACCVATGAAATPTPLAMRAPCPGRMQ